MVVSLSWQYIFFKWLKAWNSAHPSPFTKHNSHLKTPLSTCILRAFYFLHNSMPIENSSPFWFIVFVQHIYILLFRITYFWCYRVMNSRCFKIWNKEGARASAPMAVASWNCLWRFAQKWRDGSGGHNRPPRI